MNTIGERLKKIRQENDLTQNDMASLLAIASRTYKTYEQNQRVLSLDAAIKLRERFGTDLNELVGFATPAEDFEDYRDTFLAFHIAREAYIKFESRDVAHCDATESERQSIRAAGELLEKVGGTIAMSAAIRSFFPDDPARTLRAGDELNHLWAHIGGWMP